MGNKKSTNTETEGSGKPKATWPDEVVAMFCDIAVKEVAKGNRPGTHFDQKGWSNVVLAFKELTGRDYDKKQLKNKWNSLKMNRNYGVRCCIRKLVLDRILLGRLSMHLLNGGKPKFDQINPEYRKFHDVGVSPDLTAVYDNMFKGSTALGHNVMIPSATIDIEEDVEDSEHNLIFGDDEEDSEQGNECRGKKRTNVERQIEADKEKKGKGVMGGPRGKKEKVGGAAKLSKQIDRLVDVVESRSTATSVRDNGTSQGTSIQKVMRVVATLPGAKTGTKLWWFATELFCSQEKREMFSIMTDADLKLQFLILNQKKAEN